MAAEEWESEIGSPEERRRRFAELRERREAARRAAERRQLDATPVREVPMSKLHSDLRAVFAAVEAGEIAVVCKRRRAVAMIVPVVDESQLTVRDPTTAEGIGPLASEFARRVRFRRMSALRHGRCELPAHWRQPDDGR